MREIFEKRMQERQEFLDHYFVFRDGPPIGFDPKHGHGVLAELRASYVEVAERRRLESQVPQTIIAAHHPRPPLDMPTTTLGVAASQGTAPPPAQAASLHVRASLADDRPRREVSPEPPRPRAVIPGTHAHPDHGRPRRRARGAHVRLRLGDAPRSPPRPILPLRTLRLYETGVGYFERSGELAGDGATLPVPAGHLDDALKTLVVLGADGKSTVQGVEFGSSISRGHGARAGRVARRRGASHSACSSCSWASRARGSRCARAGRRTPGGSSTSWRRARTASPPRTRPPPRRRATTKGHDKARALDAARADGPRGDRAHRGRRRRLRPPSRPGLRDAPRLGARRALDARRAERATRCTCSRTAAGPDHARLRRGDAGVAHDLPPRPRRHRQVGRAAGLGAPPQRHRRGLARRPRRARERASRLVSLPARRAPVRTARRWSPPTTSSRRSRS